MLLLWFVEGWARRLRLYEVIYLILFDAYTDHIQVSVSASTYIYMRISYHIISYHIITISDFLVSFNCRTTIDLRINVYLLQADVDVDHSFEFSQASPAGTTAVATPGMVNPTIMRLGKKQQAPKDPQQLACDLLFQTSTQPQNVLEQGCKFCGFGPSRGSSLSATASKKM